MGRKKTNVVYRHFALNENNTSTCLVPECGKILKTQHGANLLKHLKHAHKEIHKEVLDINNSRQDADVTTKPTSISETVLKECTDLIAVHGRPFSLLNDKAFQNLLSLIAGNTATINASNVKHNMHIIATKMREELALTLQDKIISLKIDIASLASRSFMGINCQYLQNGELMLRNLGVLEIFQRHTSEHLKHLLMHNLRRFRIDNEVTKKIYCVTTDNGANMIKMSKLLNEMDDCTNSDTNDSVHTQAGPSQSNRENAYATNECNLDYDNLDLDLNVDETYTAQVTNILRAQFMRETGEDVEYKIGIVRCAAHTLQLALHDVCNDVAFHNLMSSCREVVRRLRTPHFVRIIRENDKSIPKLDCLTRWHSTVDMVESLLSLKDICASDVRLHLPDSTWDTLSEMLKSLTPTKELTKKLQEEQLTVGDFYLAWMICQFKLAKITTKLSNELIEAMKDREKLLFDNDVFINGIFLDPRVNSVLTTAQKKKAKENLTLLYITNFELEQQSKENSISNSNSMSTNNHSEAQIELDDFLNSSYLNNHDDLMELLDLVRSDRNILNRLQGSFEEFLKEPLLQSTESVLTYWEKSRQKFPFLYKLSAIVLAAPMTQVSVERLFSSLKFVVSNYRYSMKDNVIEDILFIRSNNIFKK